MRCLYASCLHGEDANPLNRADATAHRAFLARAVTQEFREEQLWYANEGYVSAVDSQGRTMWIVDAYRHDGKRFVVRANEKLTAFTQLERITRNDGYRN